MPRGIDCILYRNTASLGSGYGTPTWQIVGNVKDITLSWTKEAFETTSRHERGLKTYEATLSEIEVTGMIREPELAATTGDPNYDDFIAFRDAFWGNTVMHLEVLNGGRTTSGTIGLNGFWKVTEWTEDQSNGVALFMSFKLQPAHVDATTLATTNTAEAMRHAKVVSGTMQYANFGSTSFA